MSHAPLSAPFLGRCRRGAAAAARAGRGGGGRGSGSGGGHLLPAGATVVLCCVVLCMWLLESVECFSIRLRSPIVSYHTYKMHARTTIHASYTYPPGTAPSAAPIILPPPPLPVYVRERKWSRVSGRAVHRSKGLSKVLLCVQRNHRLSIIRAAAQHNAPDDDDGRGAPPLRLRPGFPICFVYVGVCGVV